jgi:hypothetical protein
MEIENAKKVIDDEIFILVKEILELTLSLNSETKKNALEYFNFFEKV